ncbi:exocyst complex component Sec10 [Gloeophyllum trabeum ATCC 11539]|uniref:Exocyst complex component Sec10 n=1 Tax=Gloeophyllum trabeum (strain ATCC 11539 / FP-39264 / Madison 617) TaxID=670483 RepID=S7QIJ8_GLOTA|nr:exocyst complex component Sec10 [Gloeophyllum trabeum ATCC 11539]EPQ59103.1 exocyst complex component Sec10 [Gloeophyllum trabeum ATCC 11539]
MDPNIEEHLQLKAFEGKFDVKDFIGSVSERLITQSKSDAGPFDPKPFIRTFEEAVDRLIKVRKDVQARTEQLERTVRTAEREYSKKMADLNKGFEAVGNSFSGMEARMNEVGRTAIRIGEQLESVHLERQRAQAAYDLIDYYNQFSRDDTSKLDALKKEGREGRRQVAVILRRLSTVAKEVDLPTAEKTREAIDKYCEKFEKDMLYLFDRCYRKGDPKMMHHCAQTLLDFNGGASCVQVYVNQHDFFINRIRETTTSNDTILWQALPEPDSIPPKTESGLLELFAEIRTTVGQEAQIVQAVFPNPPYVMQVFLQRIFAQSIQQYVEQLLNKAATYSDLAYLRILQLVHLQTSLLVEDLKSYELPSVTPRSPVDAAEFRRSMLAAPSASGAAAATTASLSSMLEGVMEELFVPYTEGQRYLEKESRSLGELYSSHLANFTRYHEKSHKGPSSMFNRMMNQLSAAASDTSTAGGLTSSSAQAAASAFMRFRGITAEKKQEPPTEEPLREEDGQLSIEVAEKMLKWHAEAIGRCVELTPNNDVPKHTFALLRVLAEAIGSAYIETALETALARLEAADPKAEPNLQLLSVLRSVDLICHLWQQYVNIALFPLASSSVTVRREMVVFNNQTISRIEGTANTFMQRITDSVVSWLSAQLAKQKKNDFKPRNDDLRTSNTEPCVACCEMLEKVCEAAKQNLSGKNLEVFLTEVGNAFHCLLLEHLRKFPVNATGGIVLVKDLKAYQDIIDTFSIPALHERFEFIRQLGNIFLLGPDILKSFITDSYLGRIDTALLRPYLAQRSDWGQFGSGFNDEGEDTVSGLPESKGLKGRLGVGRLSMMMKDLEGLRLGEGMTMNMPSIPSGFTGSFSLSARAFGAALP